MKRPASLSVAIVTYHTEPALLARALTSLAGSVAVARAAGVLDAVQVFVIDNNTDATEHAAIAQAALAWPEAAGPVEVLHGHGNLGYGRANNLVLGRLDSDLHLVLNPDVEIAPDALRNALGALERNSDVGLVAPAVFDGEGERQYLCKRYPSVWVLFLRGFAPKALQRRFASTLARYEMRDVVGENYLDDIPLASGCFLLLRTPLFVKLRGFDPAFFMYFEDYDLSLRLARESRIAYVPGARIVHHGGDASRKGWRHVAWFVASACRFFGAHGWRIR